MMKCKARTANGKSRSAAPGLAFAALLATVTVVLSTWIGPAEAATGSAPEENHHHHYHQSLRQKQQQRQRQLADDDDDDDDDRGDGSASFFGRDLSEESILEFEYARYRQRHLSQEGHDQGHDHQDHGHHDHGLGGDGSSSIMPCGFVDFPEFKEDMAIRMYEWKESNHGRNLAETAHTIPVNFYVFQPDPTVGNVPYETLQRLVDEANEAFRRGSGQSEDDSPFRFEIHRAYSVVDPNYASCRNENEFTRTFRRGGVDVLNVYLCDTYSEDAAGWSRPPPVTVHPLTRHFDGVVLMNPTLRVGGNVIPFHSVVGTFIHELGHWMGLLHTFEDGCSSGPEWQHEYAGAWYNYQVGDGVADTPAHKQATRFENEINDCWQDQGLDTCDDSIPGIDRGLDPIDNFMNYIPGSCREKYGRFTVGQHERMMGEYEEYRLRCRSDGDSCRESSDCCHRFQCRASSSDDGRGPMQCLPKPKNQREAIDTDYIFPNVEHMSDILPGKKKRKKNNSQQKASLAASTSTRQRPDITSLKDQSSISTAEKVRCVKFSKPCLADADCCNNSKMVCRRGIGKTKRCLRKIRSQSEEKSADTDIDTDTVEKSKQKKKEAKKTKPKKTKEELEIALVQDVDKKIERRATRKNKRQGKQNHQQPPVQMQCQWAGRPCRTTHQCCNKSICLGSRDKRRCCIPKLELCVLSAQCCSGRDCIRGRCR